MFSYSNASVGNAYSIIYSNVKFGKLLVITGGTACWLVFGGGRPDSMGSIASLKDVEAAQHDYI